MLGDLGRSAVCAAVLGVVSSFGDWLWTNYIPDGAVIPGVAHGLAIFVLLAGVLAWAAGGPGVWRRLLGALPLAGLLLAALFYPIAYLTGYLPALLITWFLMWLVLAFAQRWARGGSEPASRAALRGFVAAIGSGLAFWSISGIWTEAPPQAPNYLLRALQWSYAFLPGFLALLLWQARTQKGMS